MDWLVIVLWGGAIILSCFAIAGEIKKKKLQKAQIAEIEAKLKAKSADVVDVVENEQ